MGGLSCVHDYQSDGGCEGSCDPLETWRVIIVQVKAEDDGDDDADEGAEEVAEDEGARLSQRDVNGAVAENGGCSIGGYYGRHISTREIVRVSKYGEEGAESPKSPNKAPEVDDVRGRWGQFLVAVSEEATEWCGEAGEYALDVALREHEGICVRHAGRCR